MEMRQNDNQSSHNSFSPLVNAEPQVYELGNNNEDIRNIFSNNRNYQEVFLDILKII